MAKHVSNTVCSASSKDAAGSDIFSPAVEHGRSLLQYDVRSRSFLHHSLTHSDCERFRLGTVLANGDPACFTIRDMRARIHGHFEGNQRRSETIGSQATPHVVSSLPAAKSVASQRHLSTPYRLTAHGSAKSEFLPVRTTSSEADIYLQHIRLSLARTVVYSTSNK